MFFSKYNYIKNILLSRIKKNVKSDLEIINILNLLKNSVGYPDIKVLESATGSEVFVDNKKILMFGSYNYLGLANRKEVIDSAVNYVKKFGIGTGGVRLLTGSMVIHEEMENLVANFTGHNNCVSIASGFGTNAGIIPAVSNLLGFGKLISARKLVIFSDEYNHASIVDGCRLSKAKVLVYKHNNIIDLEEKLSRYKYNRKLIITDGVFSMDGDIAKLDKILDLAKEYNALTMVDDAHSIGVFGKTGSGTAEHFNRIGEVDINMGTFSKGLGVSGGFVSCSKDLADYFRVACRTYMFSDSLSPAIVGGVIGSINYIKEHPEIREKLRTNYEYFNSNLKKMGFDTFNSNTQVVPLLVGSDYNTMLFFKKLFDYGLFAPAVRWPAVPKNTGRIRFSIMSSHNKTQIDTALNMIETVGRQLHII